MLILAFISLVLSLCPSLAWAQRSCTFLNQPALMSLFSDNAGPSSITPANIRSIVCSLMGGPTATATPNWQTGNVPIFGNSGLAGNTSGPFLVDSGINLSQAFTVPVPLVLVDNKTGPITATGATISGATTGSPTADQIESYVFCTAAGQNLITQCGGGNYDGVRGIGISNPGTTLPLITGVSGYVLSEQAFSGSGPWAVALFGTGAAIVDGARVTGLNTNVSDSQYRIAQPPGTHNRLVNGAELDVSASYTDTTLTGLLIAGNSVVQPANSSAISVVGQDFLAPIPGSIARWSQAIFTFNGVAQHFANIGTKLPIPTSITGFNSDTQDFLMGAYVNGVGFQGQFYFGTAHSPNFSSATQPSFNMNYPLQVAGGGIVARTNTDQIVQLTGHVDMTSGAAIVSRDDANSTLLPLELLSDLTMVNAPLVLSQKTANALNTVVGCSAATKGGIAIVTDAAGTPAWGGVMAGGGSGFNMVMCTGTQWIYQ